MKKASLLPSVLFFASVPALAVPAEYGAPLEPGEPTANQTEISAPAFWQLMQSDLKEAFAELESSMELVLEEILTPTGAPKTKWRESGEDIAAILASLPGGPTANALLTTGEVPTLTFFGPIPPGLMDGWQLVQAGVNSVAPADAASGGFVAIGRRHLAFSDDRAHHQY